MTTPADGLSYDPTTTSTENAHGSAPLAGLVATEIPQSIRSSSPTADLSLSLDLHKQAATEDPPDPASYYWDASTMAPLNAVSAAAIARLRAYKPPPFPTWDRLPVSRRAAVLILLFADRRGDLRVVITMRAASLRSFSDQIARREAWEEIGLPADDARLPRPFRIEPLCSLPCSLAKTELAVRPCVALLRSDEDDAGADAGAGAGAAPAPPVDETMIPRLDAKEVAAVFSAPFRNFLRARDEPRGPGPEPEPLPLPLPPGDWYDGRWVQWHGEPWRVHNFRVPVDDQKVTRPRQAPAAEDEDEGAEQQQQQQQRFLVWGLTGRMLVDAARVAYAEEPEFEHNAHYGDEAMIARLEAAGALPEKKQEGRRDVGLDALREEVKDVKM
ncbi:hypothetical protein GGS23DRAFT_598209 [Durotheca rogersii]|uniref:uncharacterized protein n=1 Tax=Durotheca rogersii TaxID=419775 RepID=UPI00221E3FD5|nr:uncharacterized protein GGS23DRAFT_598209 [Durotheca rogersii]KAI5861807.1 hypothetical protein GGS23DRAFT_598209 [Durotheca rogersii]